MHPMAAQSLLLKRKEPLGTFLIGSAVGHAAVVAIGVVVSLIWGSPLMDLEQKPITATLVRKGKPRDEKLLPRVEEQPPPPKEIQGADAPPVPAPPDKAVAVPIPNIKPTVKNTAKQTGEKTGEDRRKQLFGAFNKTAKPGKAEELEGQEDGDPDGDSATAEGERYYALIKSQVRRLYDVSNTINEQERLHLSANVALKISRTGAVTSVKLMKPSGNSLFDNAVLAAVQRASPFSPPPDHLRDDLAGRGISINFKP
jgi:TonB family protein